MFEVLWAFSACWLEKQTDKLFVRLFVYSSCFCTIYHLREITEVQTAPYLASDAVFCQPIRYHIRTHYIASERMKKKLNSKRNERQLKYEMLAKNENLCELNKHKNNHKDSPWSWWHTKWWYRDAENGQISKSKPHCYLIPFADANTPVSATKYDAIVTNDWCEYITIHRSSRGRVATSLSFNISQFRVLPL